MLIDNLQAEERVMGEERRETHPALVKGRDGIFHGHRGLPHPPSHCSSEEWSSLCCASLFPVLFHSPCCRDSV